MSQVPTLVGIVVGLLAILAIIASVTAFLKSQIGEKTILLQKEEITALEQRNRTLTEDMQALRGRVQALETENLVLRGTVTQELAIAELTRALQEHHAASKSTWAEVLDRLGGGNRS